jgi:hypothetical protein
MQFGLEKVRIAQVELQPIIFLLRFFVLFVENIIIHVRVVVNYTSCQVLTRFNF